MSLLPKRDSMKSLRILLVMIEPPLPFGNAAARWFYVLLKGLVERGHSVTAFVSCSKSEDIEKAMILFPADKYDLRCYPSRHANGLLAKLETLRQPYSYLFSPELRRDLDSELQRNFDVLHLEQLWSGWLGLGHKERAVVNVHYLFSLDRVFQSPDTLENRIRRFITYRAEEKLLRYFPMIMTLSDRMTDHIARLNPHARLYTIPLGIDLSLYPFNEQKQSSKQPVAGLIGSFNWAPSYSAAELLLTLLWPEIKSRVPDARLLIAGRSANDMLSSFAGLPDVEIYHDVPDILPYFNKIDVFIYAPRAGSGMKVKILEAFALGVPVVTNQDGVEGIPAQDGIHADICEDDNDLIARAVDLLKSPAHRKIRRLKARQLVEKYCSPAVALEKVEQVYETISK